MTLRSKAEKRGRLLAATSYHNKNGVERWAATAAYAMTMMDLYVPTWERKNLDQLMRDLYGLEERCKGPEE